jgi:probable rRNA maturation factor
MIKIHVETDPKYKPLKSKVILDGVLHLFNSKDIIKANISFIFGDDDLLSGLKKEFFKLDHLTDVIAFRLNDYEEKNIEGEIYISIPRAKENAIEFKEPLNRELGRLIIHGCLHLLGFNDETNQEKIEMRKQEDYYLDMMKWKNIYG